jgi:hypothetical protein
MDLHTRGIKLIKKVNNNLWWQEHPWLIIVIDR